MDPSPVDPVELTALILLPIAVQVMLPLPLARPFLLETSYGRRHVLRLASPNLRVLVHMRGEGRL